MAANGAGFPLPTGPTNLCFNKDEFMKENFSVDKFVSECRIHAPLECIRDDLNVYLRILRTAMIELINKDYADFVNLSTNLVGFDKAINNLVLPLGQLKEEVLCVQSVINEAAKATKDKLMKRQKLREKKACLQHLLNTAQCVEKIEQLLNIKNSESKIDHMDDLRLQHRELTGDLIERVATEFNQLHFYKIKSKGHVFVEDIKPRIVHITRVLQQSLEQSFLEGVETGDLHKLVRCLRIYATIDGTKDVEELFRQKIVRPYLQEIVTEEFLKSQLDGLGAIYKHVLDFIPKHCLKLKEATKGSNSSGAICGYDFIVNAVWPEVVLCIETRISSIFAPGNPDSFHEKYVLSMIFLENLEQACGSQMSVKRLRDHSAYIGFISKWNLPVYFQIRFQSLAGLLEEALLSPWDRVKDEKNSKFFLNATLTLWKCLHSCWSSTIFLYPLCHRFWKLNLLLVARYTEWVRTVVQSEASIQRLREEQVELPATNAVGIVDGTQQQLMNGLYANTNKSAHSKAESSISLAQYVLLVSDIQTLFPKLPVFCDEVIYPVVKGVGFQDMNLLKDSMREFEAILTELLSQFTKFITEDIASQSAVHLKLVNDIPRLYRRTNRELPSKPSGYVINILRPLELFMDEHPFIQSTWKQSWGLMVLNTVTQQYHDATANVLTAVKKMEESLSRLKKAREKGNAMMTGSTLGMSDDDKIRLQLVLDVESYGKQITSLGFDTAQLDQYKILSELVESARSSSSRTS